MNRTKSEERRAKRKESKRAREQEREREQERAREQSESEWEVGGGRRAPCKIAEAETDLEEERDGVAMSRALVARLALTQRRNHDPVCNGEFCT